MAPRRRRPFRHVAQGVDGLVVDHARQVEPRLGLVGGALLLDQVTGSESDPQGIEKFLASQEEDVLAHAQSPAGLQRQVAEQIVAQNQEILAVFTEGNVPPDKIDAAIEFPAVAAGESLAERCDAAIDRVSVAAMALQGAVAGGKAGRHLAHGPGLRRLAPARGGQFQFVGGAVAVLAEPRFQRTVAFAHLVQFRIARDGPIRRTAG